MSYVDQKLDEAAKVQTGHGERARCSLKHLKARRGFRVEMQGAGKEPERVSVDKPAMHDPGCRSHRLRVSPDTYEWTHDRHSDPA